MTTFGEAYPNNRIPAKTWTANNDQMSAVVSIRNPSTKAIKAFLNSQSKLNFTYASVGATATTPPAGCDVDRSRIRLGHGERVFLAAKAALENWTHFRLGWLEATS